MAGASTPERERAETDSALLRVLVDQLPAMLAYWDENQRCRFANRAYEKWFGIAPEWLLGRHMRELLGPIYDLNRPYIEGALRGEEQKFEREIPDPSGGAPRYSQAHYIPDVVDGVVRGFGVLVVDITERRQAEAALLRMERQLQATERLAAMSTLAAGIAHEINNPLASAVGNLELALQDLDRGNGDASAMRDRLVEARDGARRVSGIVQSMKLLARGDVTTRELVDVDKVLEQGVGFASNVIRYRARLVRELGGVAFVTRERIDANDDRTAYSQEPRR